MKTFVNILLLIGTTLLLATACEYDELTTFHSPADAYFPYLTDDAQTNDTSVVNFFYNVGRNVTVRIPVRVTGATVNIDRFVSVKVENSSTAIRGKHYTMPNTVTIPAGRVRGNLDIEITAPENPKEKKGLMLLVSIIPNADFGAGMKTMLARNLKDTNYITTYPISISDIIKRPSRWQDEYFGTYSDKKFLLICEVNEVAPSYLDSREMPVSAWFSLSRNTKIYLEDYKKMYGVPIYDENGTEMTMGPKA